ncbi:hydrolase [Falsibacillus albus]|uniref:Hydrolase n=1 Tax=Falsibacillus albus TaxID=2478915 RepID=A0A3L7JI26_9BACI|nr:hydrolase [Falsibacillus albus]RLQ89985.1 hydrolase [Falsibacillus albus]
MGSRIMHLIIGNKIAQSLSIEDKSSFLLGSIAPDAVSNKNASHFFIGDVRDYSRSVDAKGFLYKYREHELNPYVLGYYAHLIADDIWLRGFNLSWLKNRMDADEGLYGRYHQDFQLLNGKLLDYYRFTEELKEALSHFSEIIDFEEVKRGDVEEFVPYALGDMEYDQSAIKEELNVFTFNQIIGYIETSVELGIMKIKPLLA